MKLNSKLFVSFCCVFINLICITICLSSVNWIGAVGAIVNTVAVFVVVGEMFLYWDELRDTKFISNTRNE